MRRPPHGWRRADVRNYGARRTEDAHGHWQCQIWRPGAARHIIARGSSGRRSSMTLNTRAFGHGSRGDCRGAVHRVLARGRGCARRDDRLLRLPGPHGSVGAAAYADVRQFYRGVSSRGRSGPRPPSAWRPRSTTDSSGWNPRHRSRRDTKPRPGQHSARVALEWRGSARGCSGRRKSSRGSGGSPCLGSLSASPANCSRGSGSLPPLWMSASAPYHWETFCSIEAPLLRGPDHCGS
jgi:hypothetical protein